MGFLLAPRSRLGLQLRASGEAAVALRHLRSVLVWVSATTLNARSRTTAQAQRADNRFTLFFHSTIIRLLRPGCA